MTDLNGNDIPTHSDGSLDVGFREGRCIIKKNVLEKVLEPTAVSFARMLSNDLNP